MVELAVVFLIAGGIVAWHELHGRGTNLEGSLGQNDLQKSSTER